MQENDLIAAIRARAKAAPVGMLGIGDDCCVWQAQGAQCLSVDTVVEGRHFLPQTDPLLVGRKAAASALSDIAAMGARPTGAVVALSCPARWDAMALMQGILAELDRHHCALLGGDTTGAEQLTISVTVWGEAVPGGRLLRRDGGQAGDVLVVTGALGGSLQAGRHLRPEPRLAEGQWLAARDFTHALMDLSDGLGADVRRLCAASGCGAMLCADGIPVHDDVPARGDRLAAACNDGEDFELLMAIEPSAWPTLVSAWPFAVPLSQVGWLLPEPELWLENARGKVEPWPYTGFEHQAGC